MTDSWFKAIDEGMIVGALMLDLSKAFDSTPHHLIISELQSIGVGISAPEWFSSYLSNRKQRVITKTATTDLKLINKGVPQGSALSPLLFNIFVRNLPLCNNSMTFQYADDVTEAEARVSLKVIKALFLIHTRRSCCL